MNDQIRRNVMLVADDKHTTRCVLAALAAMGIRGTSLKIKDGLSRIDEPAWDLVMVDLEIAEAMQLHRKSRRTYPERPVVALAPHEQAQAAVEALRSGCTDVLLKPLQEPVVKAMLEKLVPEHHVNVAAAKQGAARCMYQIAGASKQLRETIHIARKVAPTSVPVLITGESGTGKELISHLIHCESNRSDNAYVRVNCAALNESLLESELFGHERGAFTGAVSQRKGRFERAHCGTLLLDEISETTPRLQAELLRVLEQQDFERVGGSECIQVDVRIISTSNRNLDEEIAQGRFRSDLHYRLGGVHLRVPPLRERPEDLEPLVWHFVNLYGSEVHRQIRQLDQQMLQMFRQCQWPGNIRQLRNVVRSALIFGEGETLSLDGAHFLEAELLKMPTRPTNTLSLQDIERQAVLEALRRTRKNQAKAAKLLGITDRTLREKLRRYSQTPQESVA